MPRTLVVREGADAHRLPETRSKLATAHRRATRRSRTARESGAHRRSRRSSTKGKQPRMATETAQPAGGTTPENRPGQAEHLQLEDRIWLLRAMLLMRGIEERAMSLYRQGKVPGSFYDGYGQEAVSAGAAFAMAPEDRLCILHRDLAAHLIRGVSPLADPVAVHGPGGRDHARARRQRALRRSPPGLRRDGLDAPRHDARGHRHGDGVQAARRAPLRADLVRRRLDLARRLPRGDELGRRPEAARWCSCWRTTSTPTRRRWTSSSRSTRSSAPRPTASPASPSTATTPRRCSRRPAPRASARSTAAARR